MSSATYLPEPHVAHERTMTEFNYECERIERVQRPQDADDGRTTREFKLIGRGYLTEADVCVIAEVADNNQTQLTHIWVPLSLNNSEKVEFNFCGVVRYGDSPAEFLARLKSRLSHLQTFLHNENR